MDSDVGDMATLREAKAIGATASVLLLVGSVANASSVLSIVALIFGLIMLLVATKYIAELTSNSVYTNMALAVAFLVIGLIVWWLLAAFVSLRIVITFGSSPSSRDLAGFFGPDWSTFTGTVIAGLVVIWICLIIAAFFTRKSYDKIAESLYVELFRLAATLFIIGAVLTIALGLGLIIIFAAVAVQLAAFLSLPDEPRPRRQKDPWDKPSPSATPIELPKQVRD